MVADVVDLVVVGVQVLVFDAPVVNDIHEFQGRIVAQLDQVNRAQSSEVLVQVVDRRRTFDAVQLLRHHDPQLSQSQLREHQSVDVYLKKVLCTNGCSWSTSTRALGSLSMIR